MCSSGVHRRLQRGPSLQLLACTPFAGTIFKSIIQRINTSRLPDHQRPPGG